MCGWSADWDAALVRAIERVRQRRYPLYWDSRSNTGATAQRLLAQQGGVQVRAMSADELFTGVVARVESLERLAQPPLTSALAIARLKRYLPDPTRRIDLSDLVGEAARRCADEVAARPIESGEFFWADPDQALDELLEITRPVLGLLAAGIRHDRSREHLEVWTGALQTLLHARHSATGSYDGALERLRHYPAVLALRTAGVVSVESGRDDVLLHLLHRTAWRDRFGDPSQVAAVQSLHEARVLGDRWVKQLPRWGGTKYIFPTSHLLRHVLRETLAGFVAADEYEFAHDRLEYRLGLAQFRTQELPNAYRSMPGEYIGRQKWTPDAGPQAEVEFRARASQADDKWPWWPVVGGQDQLDATLLALREDLSQMGSWR